MERVSMLSSLRIIVTGLIAQYPLGGMTWHYLQYVLGLGRLGHDVYYLEDTGAGPYNPGAGGVVKDCSYNVEYLADIMTRFGLQDKWAYRFSERPQWFGLPDRERTAAIRSADLLINISGMLARPEEYREVRRMAYVDTDPVFNQVKLAQGRVEFRKLIDAHDVHFSFGERLSEAVPATGYYWRPTRQPIALSEWRPTQPRRNVFTTIMNWTASKNALVYGGQTFGQKDVEFTRFLDLPGRVAPTVLEVAINAGKRRQAPLELLISKGWRVADPEKVCLDLDSYRRYIESSQAEWSVAKNGYVQGRSGWFSERSACYLAAGRPVIVQDTGFSTILPVGEGIVPFTTMEEAVAAITEVEGNYERRAKAARAIAEEYFDSDKVLTRLIEEALNGDAPPVIAENRRPVDVLLESPAIKAWRELRPEFARPEKIEVLKGRKETATRSAYRLTGVGPENSTIIAKRCRRAKALIERVIYEEILPLLPAPTLRYHGFVEEAGGDFCWFFLEDAGAERYSAFNAEHRRLAARWLGMLHTSSARADLAARLPDRGPRHYLERLRSARDRILGSLTNPALNADDHTVLETILSQCAILESRWDEVERLCEGMPCAVVHGDFAEKNIRIRTDGGGITILPFDWGNAGWGVPAIDLAQSPLPSFGFTGNPDIFAYWTVVRDHWPGLELKTIKQWANLATILRALVAINWDALSLAYEWVERPMIWMRLYREAMEYAMQAVGWAD
jgi:Phosphotransferase enzyme family